MAVTYYALLTTIGAGKLANATALGTTLKITQLAVGDGGGNVPTPDASRTQLVNEVRRAPLNRLSVDPANSAQIIAEQVIPEDVGGWWIREMGLYDEAGALIAYANCAPSYKPQLAEGSGRTQTVRIVLIVSNAASVELKIDPSVVLATREYVDNSIVTALNRLDYKQSVRAATTASITLSGLQTVDGVALAAGDRVLVKSQTNSVDNGLYVVATGAWRRTTDADENSEVTPGLTVTVESGTAQADSVWQLVTDGAIVLGTTALSFQNITNGLAKLASPAFSGTPTAPNPAQGDLSSRLATTTYVRNLVSGQLVKSVAGGGDVTLTADEVGYGMLVFTGTLTANINVIVPNVYRQWVVHNRTSGSFSLTLKTAAGNGWAVTQGRQRMLVCNTVDVYSPEWDFTNTPLLGKPTAPTPQRGDSSLALATTEYVQDSLTSAGLASSNGGEGPADATGLAALKSGMYYLSANVSPYPNYAFMMRMSFSGNRGFELANLPYTDRFFGRSCNNDGTWRSPVELAKLDSPILTGVPTGPTAAAGSSTQQLATTAFVQSALSPLAPLASPALSGNPTTPTVAQFDNDTSISTTAFVQRALGNQSGQNSYSGNTQLTNDDVGKVVLATNGSTAVTFTLPPAAGVPAGGVIKIISNTQYSALTVAPYGGEALLRPDSTTGAITLQPLSTLTICRASQANTWMIIDGSESLKYTSAFGSILGGSGCQVFPSGLTMQWGNVVTNASGVVGFNFPLPFQQACFQVICSPQIALFAPIVVGSLGGASSRTGSTIYSMNSTTGAAQGNITVNYLALGK
jgi:hypothetical protein